MPPRTSQPRQQDRPPVHLYGPDGRALPVDSGPAASRHQAREQRRDDDRPSLGERMRKPLDHVFEWIEAAGVQIHGPRTVLYLWRRVGLKGLVPILLLVGYPIGEYAVLSHVVNSTIPALANDFGVSFEADEWSFHPFTLTTVARNVRVRPEHPSHATPVFTAAEIIFEGNLASTWAGLHDLYHLRRFHTFNEITVKHAELHLEQSLAGRLNWRDLADQVPEEKMAELLHGVYQVSAISAEDLKVSYVEHIPGNSGGGMIETAQASVYVDDIAGSITNIRPLGAAEETSLRLVRANGPVPMPTKVHLSARSADGTIDVDGRIGLIEPSDGRGIPAAQPELRYASLGAASSGAVRSDSGGPYFEITIQLENIGVAAFFRHLTLPMRAVPASGTVRGRLVLRYPHTSQPACVDSILASNQLEMREVRYTPNPLVIIDRAQFDKLKHDYDAMPPVSKPFKPCDSGPAGVKAASGPSGRAMVSPGTQLAGLSVVISTVVAFNAQANENPPPAVRAALSADEQSLTGRFADAAVEDVAGRAGGQLGQSVTRMLGPRSGQLVQESVKTSGQGDNALAKGAKSVRQGVTHGLKRLFGRDKDDARSKPR